MNAPPRFPQSWAQWRELRVAQVMDWPARTQRVVLAILALVVLVLVGLLLLQPQWQELRAAKQQQAMLADQVRVQTHSSAAAAQAAQRQNAQTQAAQLQRKFPDAINTQAQLRALNELAQAHHIRLRSVRVLETHSAVDHVAQALRVQGEGDFHDWGRMFAGMLEAAPLLWVSELSARPLDARGIDVHLDLTVLSAAQLPMTGKQP